MEWPSLKTTSAPVWVAALSPISIYDLKEQVNLYLEYEAQGVELLVTGEISADWETKYIKGPVIRIKAKHSSSNYLEAIALLGPPGPNFLPARQGIELVRTLKTVSKKNIIANIGDSGATDYDRKRLIWALADAGADGFEIALSCPNIIHGTDNNSYNWMNNCLKMIEQVHSSTSLPIAVKIGISHLSVGERHLIMKLHDAGVTQITLTDAILSMCPPDIEESLKPPFRGFPGLSFVGMCGPWCRYLLYGGVSRVKMIMRELGINNIKVSAVGGIFSSRHAMEMISLGADSIQLSSLVLFRGYREIGKLIDGLKQYTTKKSYMNDIYSMPLYKNAQEGMEKVFGTDFVEKWMSANPVSRTNNNCDNCQICCTTPCLARKAGEKKPITIDRLCSGCGWCAELCHKHAITMVRREE